MRQNSQTSQNSEDHLHLHYHYYYPSSMRKSSHEGKDKKSVSFTQDPAFSSPKQKGGRLKTEGNELNSMTEVKKIRLSDMATLKQSQTYFQQQKVKAKSQVEEEQSNEGSQFMGRNSFLKKSTVTGLETESNNQLLAYYQTELAKFKAEVERLKMVEEECIYLRDAFYSHYTEKCPKYT